MPHQATQKIPALTLAVGKNWKNEGHGANEYCTFIGLILMPQIQIDVVEGCGLGTNIITGSPSSLGTIVHGFFLALLTYGRRRQGSTPPPSPPLPWLRQEGRGGSTPSLPSPLVVFFWATPPLIKVHPELQVTIFGALGMDFYSGSGAFFLGPPHANSPTILLLILWDFCGVGKCSQTAKIFLPPPLCF